MFQDSPTVIPIPFHGDTITCVETPEGEFVAIRPICDRLNLNFSGQLQRLKADPDLWGVCVIHTPSAGGTQETNCIPRNRVAFFLATIDLKRVKPEARERLRLYQREAADVLDRHFRLRAAEISARIAEQERMLWHCHQHLRLAIKKWGDAYLLEEMGVSDAMVAQRTNQSLAAWAEQKALMTSCGLSPTWRRDMATAIDKVSELKWELGRRTAQGDLFDAEKKPRDVH